MGAIRLSEDFKDIATNVLLVFTVIGYILTRLLAADGSTLYPINNPINGNTTSFLFNVGNVSEPFEKIFSVSSNTGENSIKLKNVSETVAEPSVAARDDRVSDPIAALVPDLPSINNSVIAPVESIALYTVDPVASSSLPKITKQILPELNTRILNADLKL